MSPHSDPWKSSWDPRPGGEEDAQLPSRDRFGVSNVRRIAENNEILVDWSRLGYTTARHVDFEGDALPTGFIEGEPLGSSNSTVYRVECLGTVLAMKKYKARDEQRRAEILNEIGILGRLRHHHVIEYVGSMTFRINSEAPTLSALFWPVAPCSLTRLIYDIDTIALALSDGTIQLSDTVESIQKPDIGSAVSLLCDILYQPSHGASRPSRIDVILKSALRRLMGSMGCLAHALFYMHRQNVSHKDIKPSNILIFPNVASYQSTERNPKGETYLDGIRLTDFDGAKTFIQSDMSMVEDTWHTAAYASPETQRTRYSGRAADIFSLGCVFLELFCLTTVYPLLAPSGEDNSSYYFSGGELRMEMGHSNFASLSVKGKLGQLVSDVGKRVTADTTSPPCYISHLQSIIQAMLVPDKRHRLPTDMLLLRLSAADVLRAHEHRATPDDGDHGGFGESLFGRCCAAFPLSQTESEYLMSTLGSSPTNPDDSNTTEPDYVGTIPHAELQEELSSSSSDLATSRLPLLITAARNREKIQWNINGQRIDKPTIPYNKKTFDQVKYMNLCQYRYLMGMCSNVDTCTFKHNYELTKEQLEIFRALKRRTVCHKGTRCDNAACFAGHNCPNSKPGTLPEDRTKTSHCVYRGPYEKCRFGTDMHDMDLRVVDES